MIKVILWIVITILSAILYRAGGMGKEDEARPKWIPKAMRHSAVRDYGVSSLIVLSLIIFHGFHWILILCYGLLVASHSTYFKKKGTDSKWYNWIFVGLAFSISLLPYAILLGHWQQFIYRLIIVTVFVPVWSICNSRDDYEEFGRGAIQTLTTIIL